MRPEKASIVAELTEKMKKSPFVLVADYQRMNVGHFGELRNRLVPVGAEMHVVKNSFLKRAMADSGFPDVGDKLTGQTAVVKGAQDGLDYSRSGFDGGCGSTGRSATAGSSPGAIARTVPRSGDAFSASIE